MKNLEVFISLPAVETLGWTLLHFLWQGALIAVVLAVLLWLLRTQQPTLRYSLACAGLTLMLACPIGTYWVLVSRQPATRVVAVEPLPLDPAPAQPLIAATVPPQAAPTNVALTPEGKPGQQPSWLETHFKPWLPYFVTFWCLGVLLLSVRLLGGLWYIRNLRTRLTRPVSTALMAQLNSVAERLGLARPVQLRESLVVTVPLVVGWLRPLILLPSSVVSGLSVGQLELILAHELAHIRRHDYLVNLLQSVIETLLFYHPGVWWVSACIRNEREHCCDDLAVKVCGGDKLAYARALADLDDLRATQPLVQAATGGSLLKRILRLADRARPKALEPRQWFVGLSTMAVSLLIFSLLGANLSFAQNEEVTLQFAIPDAQGRPSEVFVQEFSDQVRTLSAGNMTIEPIWEAGNDTEAGYEVGTIEHVAKGDYELGVAASRVWNAQGVTSFDALQAPFLITNDALAEAVATSDAAQQMLEGMASAGFVGLTLWPEDLRHPFAIAPQTPLLTPEDFVGLNIRTTPSSVSYELVKALGATPMFEDSGYQGAESGLLQGATLTGSPTATGNVVFFSKYQVLFANAAALDTLTDEQRTVLREAAAAAQQKAIAEHPSEVDAATAWCADGGSIVLASDEQVAAFETAAQPVFDQIEQDPQNADFIAAIRDLKASTEPSPGAEACGSAATQQNPEPSAETEVWSEGLPPNGVWQKEITTDDLVGVAMRSDPQGWVGLYTLTYQDGTARFDWQGEQGQTGKCVFTYAEVEDFIRFTSVDKVDECPNEVDDMQWRLDADGNLHLKVINVQNGKLIEAKAMNEGKPWQKVETWSAGLPPNGTWQVELTAEELLKMGLRRSKAELWAGAYTWTLQDGKATTRGEGIEPYFCEATYEAVEAIVRFTYTAGSDCEGETDDMKWRLGDDGLHLQLVDIKNAPFFENRAYLEAKPWQRIE